VGNPVSLNLRCNNNLCRKFIFTVEKSNRNGKLLFISGWNADWYSNYPIINLVLETNNPDHLISISTVGTLEFYAESVWSVGFLFTQFLCSLMGWVESSLASDLLFTGYLIHGILNEMKLICRLTKRYPQYTNSYLWAFLKKKFPTTIPIVF